MRTVHLPWRELAEIEAKYSVDMSRLGDIDLLRLAIKDLLPLSENERHAALFDCNAHIRQLIWEGLHPELVIAPCWAGATQSAENST